ncbi:hypothetical protein BDY21DRAFT_424866 [Lineolata rhizophorae]|uniref:Zn(2)-C6 fungal-type domain-containing protein n=1 Tax=Lineolata rhizophorae TaxID=578093 RepID=A0A6A6NM51_9PEZI|nr:hypothetical protein BDY21DRAFT_424866 [Lineolata rhizophorae]
MNDSASGRSKPHTRKKHRKSRAGCLPCKRRHIKCDEGRPRCINCSDYDLECEYKQHIIQYESPYPATSRPRSSAASASNTPPLETPAPAPAPAPASSAQPPSTLNIADLELLHHWMSTNIITFDPVRTRILKTEFPRRGFRHPFLLRGLFAVSAMHLAYLHARSDPSTSHCYAVRAAEHQHIALGEFRAALARGIDEGNYEAVFCFACVLVPIAFVSEKGEEEGRCDEGECRSSGSGGPGQGGRAGGAVEGIVKVMSMIRGCVPVFDPWRERIKQGPLGSFTYDPMRTRPPVPVPELAFLRAMIEQGDTAAAASVGTEADMEIGMETPSSTSSSSDAFPLPTPASMLGLGPQPAPLSPQAALGVAFTELETTFSRKIQAREIQRDGFAAVCVWPAAVPPEYMKLLRQREPRALVLLAYFAMLLHDYDRRWILDGWARRVVMSVECLLREEWRHWLEWPKQMVELEPPELSQAER